MFCEIWLLEGEMIDLTSRHPYAPSVSQLVSHTMLSRFLFSKYN